MVQVIRADLDEIVFENREKTYGGYVLRKNYQKHLAFGMLMMLTSIVLGTVFPLIYQQFQGLWVNNQKNVIIEVTDVYPPSTKEKKKLTIEAPLPPKPKEIEAPLPPKIAEIAVKTPVPKPPTQVVEEVSIHTVEETAVAKAGIEDTDGEKAKNLNAPTIPNSEPKGTGDAPATIQEPPVSPANTAIKPEEQVNKEPSPTDYINAKQPKEVNLSDIQKLIGYPAAAVQMDLEETIVFRILVDENGNYVRHLPPKKGHPILIRAVEEHISKVKFTPAIQTGKPIKFWVNVPFTFHLR